MNLTALIAKFWRRFRRRRTGRAAAGVPAASPRWPWDEPSCPPRPAPARPPGADEQTGDSFLGYVD